MLVSLIALVCSVGCFSQSTKHNRIKKIETSEAETTDSISTKKKNVVKVKDAEISKTTETLGKRYLFGVATSYADSVTMLTNICEVDGMESRVQEKTPIGLELYTQSLKDFLLKQGKTGYVCATFVCKSRKEAEQKLLSVRNDVVRKKMTALQSVGDFKYQFISTEHIYTNEKTETDSGDDF